MIGWAVVGGLAELLGRQPELTRKQKRDQRFGLLMLVGIVLAVYPIALACDWNGSRAYQACAEAAAARNGGSIIVAGQQCEQLRP